MIPSFFLPLDKQFDDGLGSIAIAFHAAAKKLTGDAPRTRHFQSSLPICYLYRHAIELYLKSLLVIVWRRYSGSRDPLPSVSYAENKTKQIDRVHAVAALYDRWKSICEEHAVELSKVDPRLGTTTGLIAPGLDEAITAIDAADRQSDYFRYPVSRSGLGDAAKSSMKPESLESVEKRTRRTPSKVLALLIVDENKNPIEAFTLQQDEIDVLTEHLKKAADDLSGLHAWFDAVVVAGQRRPGG